MVGQSVPRVLIQCMQGEKSDVDDVLREIHQEYRLINVSIVGDDDVITHHTSPNLVGQVARSEHAQFETWDKIQVARYRGTAEIPVYEFRAPLNSGNRNFGTLRLASIQHSLWATLVESYEYVLLAFLIPALVLGVSAIILRRSMRPIAQVESQLRRALQHPSSRDVLFGEIQSQSAVAEGWNRIVKLLKESRELSAEKIQEKVSNYRSNEVLDILNSLPDGLAVTDHSNAIKYNNRSFTSLFSSLVDEGPVQGRNILDFICQETDGSDHPFRGNSKLIEEVEYNDGNQERIFRIARFKLRDSDNVATQKMVWTVRDITQFKLTEKMRDEFLDSATHELRTPLSNIKAYAETLAISEVLDVEQQKEFCNTINSEASRLSRFIDDLLSISNVEAGSLAIARENVEVDRMMRDVVGKVKPSMIQKQIEFNVSLPQKRLPSLFIDKDKIQVALVNLLGNAAKYTAEGGRVDVEVKFADNQIYFSVEDTGIGISDEDLPKLFDKFFRSANDAVQEVTGTGLGLSLAREIIQLHGGKVHVESQLGKGSKFTVSLPAKMGALV